MEGIIGTLEFYAPVIILGVSIIGIVYLMKKKTIENNVHNFLS
ncbi:hypothetical protein [Streptococcus phocae]|nr:hypothetical protein [Streptococcus phocae]